VKSHTFSSLSLSFLSDSGLIFGLDSGLLDLGSGLGLVSTLGSDFGFGFGFDFGFDFGGSGSAYTSALSFALESTLPKMT